MRIIAGILLICLTACSSPAGVGQERVTVWGYEVARAAIYCEGHDGLSHATFDARDYMNEYKPEIDADIVAYCQDHTIQHGSMKEPSKCSDKVAGTCWQ
jgi:hypothetical protein